MRTAFGLLCFVLLSAVAFSASHLHILRLYSWKPAGQPWHYTLTEDVQPRPDDAAIIHSREVYIGEAALEKRLSALPPNYYILWTGGPRGTLFYAPETLRNQVIEFARKRGLNIELSPIFYD